MLLNTLYVRQSNLVYIYFRAWWLLGDEYYLHVTHPGTSGDTISPYFWVIHSNSSVHFFNPLS